MNEDLILNAAVSRKGYITQAYYLRSKPPAEVEALLGYGPGTLSGGWWLLFLEKKPAAEDFEFRGYTQMSGGIPLGHLNPAGGKTAEQSLKAGGYDVPAMKQTIISSTFQVSGYKRLCKVVPVRKAADFPPGKGIPQWELVKPLPFRVAAVIQPGGMYLGDYA